MTQVVEKPLLLTRVQAAKALNLCTRTVQAYTAKGLIKAVPVGARWMYRPEDLAAFAETGTSEPVHK